MKILKIGDLEGKTVARECDWCGTEIEATRSEFKKGSSFSGKYMDCPVCKHSINY